MGKHTPDKLDLRGEFCDDLAEHFANLIQAGVTEEEIRADFEAQLSVQTFPCREIADRLVFNQDNLKAGVAFDDACVGRYCRKHMVEVTNDGKAPWALVLVLNRIAGFTCEYNHD